ncbi:MAG: hypothetical protein BroJett011_76060 [Chloroflexota bacterium]|nr:MAG: hypothetical protein BroJett011_76060 [Chloroflexota bacterium]
MPRQNVSRTMQSYLQMLSEQMHHYATLRLFDGIEVAGAGKLCLDAQVPALLSDEAECVCALVVYVSFCKEGVYGRELLHFESHYDPNEVLALGPARWGQMADLLAYQLVSQLVQWKKEHEMVAFSYLAPTTGLKPDRQRFYL